MTQIETRVEATGKDEPDYAGRKFGASAVAKQSHRRFVGGHWERIGRLQRDFLVQQGLEPGQRFLDVGCGSLRAGRHLVEHLEPGNYHGIDVNADLVAAGYDHELTDEQRERLPVANLRSTDRFDADFGVEFDMAIAQSVFTHISLNHVRLCLARVAQVMRSGGRFFITFNEQPEDFPVDGIPERGHYTERNVFWYYREDIRWAASFSPWSFRYLGDWGHPRDQRMIELTRT